MYSPKEPINVEQNTNDTLQITYREKSMCTYWNGKSVPDRITRETYGIVDGSIQIIKEEEWTHTPWNFVEESITFNK